MEQNNKTKIHHCTCQTCLGHPYSKVAKVHLAINRFIAGLDEKNRRRYVGLLALQAEHGGIQQLIEITGVSRNTIIRGRAEIQRRDQISAGRVRRPGGGRQIIEKKSLKS